MTETPPAYVEELPEKEESASEITAEDIVELLRQFGEQFQWDASPPPAEAQEDSAAEPAQQGNWVITAPEDQDSFRKEMKEIIRRSDANLEAAQQRERELWRELKLQQEAEAEERKRITERLQSVARFITATGLSLFGFRGGKAVRKNKDKNHHR